MMHHEHQKFIDSQILACSTFIAQVQGGGQNNNYLQGNDYLHFTSDSTAASKCILLSNGNAQDNGGNI
jgi:hypothetical protein